MLYHNITDLKVLIKHTLLCRSHSTLLAGDAWGRVFTWTCEWKVGSVLTQSRLWHPLLHTLYPLRENLTQEIQRCLRSDTSWELRSAIFQFRPVCLHSWRTMPQYLEPSSFRQYRYFFLSCSYLILYVSLYNWISNNVNKTIGGYLLNSFHVGLFDLTLKYICIYIYFFSSGIYKGETRRTLAIVPQNCCVNLNKECDEKHRLKNSTLN